MSTSQPSSTTALPSLPLPTLDNLFQKLIEYIRPLDMPNTPLNKEKAQLLAHLQDLLAGSTTEITGLQKLQQATEILQESRAKWGMSFIEPIWGNMYLSTRQSLTLWNYAYTFAPRTFRVMPGSESELTAGGYSVQALTASLLMCAAMHLRCGIGSGAIFHDNFRKSAPPELRIDPALCPDQLRRLMRCVRIPHEHVDGLHMQSYNDMNVLVLCRGEMFVLPWVHKNRPKEQDSAFTIAYPGFEIDAVCNAAALQAIIESTHKVSFAGGGKSGKDIPAIPSLTSWTRDEWANAYKYIRALSPKNKNYLDAIANCAFAICLDERLHTERQLAKGALLGRCWNRWYDMNTSFIVHADGSCAMNNEHCWGDGHTTQLLANFCAHWMDSHAAKIWDAASRSMFACSVVGGPVADIRAKRWLRFKLSPQIADWVADAEGQQAALSAKIQIFEFTIREFGTDGIKKNCKVSPDSFFHSALQVSQSIVYGDIRSVYASLMMKMYHKGRTETLRAVTDASRELVAAANKMLNARGRKVPNEAPLIAALQKAMQTASLSHVSRINECRKGKGVCRHLKALIHTNQLCPDVHTTNPILESPVITEMLTDYLSTSNVSTPGVEKFLFAPVTDAGLGIGYTLRPESIRVVVTSFAGSARYSSSKYRIRLPGATISQTRKLRDAVWRGDNAESFGRILMGALHQMFGALAVETKSKL